MNILEGAPLINESNVLQSRIHWLTNRVRELEETKVALKRTSITLACIVFALGVTILVYTFKTLNV